MARFEVAIGEKPTTLDCWNYGQKALIIKKTIHVQPTVGAQLAGKVSEDIIVYVKWRIGKILVPGIRKILDIFGKGIISIKKIVSDRKKIRFAHFAPFEKFILKVILRSEVVFSLLLQTFSIETSFVIVQFAKLLSPLLWKNIIFQS